MPRNALPSALVLILLSTLLLCAAAPLPGVKTLETRLTSVVSETEEGWIETEAGAFLSGRRDSRGHGAGGA